MLLFELFSIEKWTTLSNQTDIYLTSIVIGQKSTNQIAQYMVENWCGFRMLLLTSGAFGTGLRVIFGEYSDIVEKDIIFF